MAQNINVNSIPAPETAHTNVALGISVLGLISAAGAVLTNNQLPFTLLDTIHTLSSWVSFLSPVLSAGILIGGHEHPGISRSENIRLSNVLNLFNISILALSHFPNSIHF